MEILVLPGDPPVAAVPDEVDLHGLPTVDHVEVTGTEPVPIGVEDLELVETDDGGLVTLFPGVLRLGTTSTWVPAGARIVRGTVAAPGARVASWVGSGRAVLAVEAGVVRWTDLRTRPEEDVTGFVRHVTTAPGTLVVERDGVAVQREHLPAGAYLHLADGEACTPGTRLAWPMDPVHACQLPAPRPRRPIPDLLAAVVAAPSADPEAAGRRLGDLVKLVGDAPAVVRPALPAELADALAEVGRRRAPLQTWFSPAHPHFPVDVEAERRCRFRFLRGLRAVGASWR